MFNDRRNPGLSIGRRNRDTALQTIIAHMDDVILELDRAGTILFISKVLPGYRMDEIVGCDFCDWAPVSEHATMRASLERVFISGESAWYQAQGAGAPGTTRWYESRLTPIIRDDTVQSVILITTDITVRKHAELEALKQTQLIQLFYNMPLIGMTITDPVSRKWVTINDKLCDILGYSREELLSLSWESLTHPDDLQVSLREFNRLRSGLCDAYTLEKRYIHRSGSIVHLMGDVHAARDADANPVYFVAILQDVTTRKQQEERIHHLAHHDLLTDLPNRVLLADRLDQALLRGSRGQTLLALLFLDLDKFKPVNDAWGHEAGDRLLKAVALRLRQCVRASDTVARMGGDEFVILLSPLEGVGDAVTVAEKIVDAMQQPFTLTQALSVRIGCSIGIAISPDHAATSDDLLRHADDAMYAAKAAGRNRAHLFQPLQPPVPRA